MIETERLKLIPITLDHGEEIFKIWGDPEVNKYLWDPLYKEADEVKQLILKINNNSNNLDYAFTITLKTTEEIIGTCGIGPKGGEDEWEFGYCFNPKAWGKGYATETLKALIELAKSKGIKTILGEAAIDNPQSIKVMKKNGLQFYKDTVFTKSDGSKTYEAQVYKLNL